MCIEWGATWAKNLRGFVSEPDLSARIALSVSQCPAWETGSAHVICHADCPHTAGDSDFVYFFFLFFYLKLNKPILAPFSTFYHAQWEITMAHEKNVGAVTNFMWNKPSKFVASLLERVTHSFIYPLMPEFTNCQSFIACVHKSLEAPPP